MAKLRRELARSTPSAVIGPTEYEVNHRKNRTQLLVNGDTVKVVRTVPAPSVAPLFASFVALGRNFWGFSMGANALRLPARGGEGDLPGGDLGAPRFPIRGSSLSGKGRPTELVTRYIFRYIT